MCCSFGGWLIGAANNLIALTTNDTSRSIMLTVSLYSDNSPLTELCVLNGTLRDRQMTARLRRQRVHLQMPPVSWWWQLSSEATVHTVRPIRWNYRGTERHSHQAGSAQVAVNKSWGAGHREASLWYHRHHGSIGSHWLRCSLQPPGPSASTASVWTFSIMWSIVITSKGCVRIKTLF